MKQIDFIQLLSNKLPESFKTEELLLVLIESSSPNQDMHEIRKCMHNHLYRLELQNLIKRLCPKRTRNASFKRLFNFDPVNLSLLESSPLQSDSKYSSSFQLIEDHAKKLKIDTHILSKKKKIFSQFTENYKMYEPLITRKLSELDSAILDKKIELEAIHELMSAINCISASESLKTSPV